MLASQTSKTRKEGNCMKASKIFFILGVIAGICTYIAWVAGYETTQYILALVTLIALAIGDIGQDRTEC